jgi:phosphate transport system permease protein
MENTKRTIHIVNAGLGKRYRAEKRFRLYGLSAILISMIFLALLFISIIGTGYPAFFRTLIRLDINFDPETVSEQTLSKANYSGPGQKITP